MTPRRALVVHKRMPAFDRDSGSQDIDYTIQFLLRSGWKVTFLAQEEQGVAEERHAHRLRQMGVATHAGFGVADELLRSNDFDLAVIAFWELASELLPPLRAQSPDTRVVIHSIDIHFLRDARRSFGRKTSLERTFGDEAARELNAYNAADAVIAVSDKERELLAEFLGESRVFTLPLAENIERSPHPLEARQGMYFVGNFRHPPNCEAVEYLCAEVLPLLDPELLARHPLTVLGNWLDRVKLHIDPATSGVQLVGWVPSVQPYIAWSRLGVVPLLHGAGVKRKVIQSMMAGTPVITTPVGAEGLDLVQGEHALIAVDGADLAAGITRALTDDDLWHRLANAGADHVDARHGVELVERRFLEIVDSVMARRRRPPTSANKGKQFDVDHDEDTLEEVRRRIPLLGRPGDVVLVVARGDDDLLDVPSHRCWAFPQDRDGGAADRDPVDGLAAINHLEAQRARGARFFVLPRTSFSWRDRYRELFDRLENVYRRVHQDEHLAVYDLSPTMTDAVRLEPTPSVRVEVIGTYAAHRTGPPTWLLTELGSSARLTVEQRWRPDEGPEENGTAEAPPVADDTAYVVYVRDDAVLPSGFLDTLIATQATLGADRLQPAHHDGPSAGPPITERHLGAVAREIDEVSPLPVLSVRAGAHRNGPVTLADNVTIGLRRPLTEAYEPGSVRCLWLVGSDGTLLRYERPEPPVVPRISVLIATYNRSDLLRECLASFADQTVDRSEYEIVVIDDGSDDHAVTGVLAEQPDDLQIVSVRIAHAGRSSAKNHAVFLARAPIVLFFDDDDRAAADYLERHLAGHSARPGEAVAILGQTDWAPEVEPTALMHFITDVDRLLFAYERLRDGQELDWRGFWEGRISCKRALLLRHGVHDQRLEYSIDVEMGKRLASAGLRVIYDASARSVMARPIDFDAFCDRMEAKARAQVVIAALHPDSEAVASFKLDDAKKLWDEKGMTEANLRRRVADLEARCRVDDAALPDLHMAYREAFRLLYAKGVARATEGAPDPLARASTVQPFENTDPVFVGDGTPSDRACAPLMTVTIPVWSHTAALAEMARRTIERIWEVARIPTEVVVVDNGSPFEVPLPAKVYRYPENKGIATGWNAGVRLSSAPVVAIVNSDCIVEPGWDVALYEASADSRRIAFPYTDHGDGLGFTRPDQAGTAGWCFMMSKAIGNEVGVFDEWFNPAFCEDTDYWHRAWQMGIDLSPVPAARVVHARRTTATNDARTEMLLQSHRYKYGWKHGVDPHRAPPYYNRDIVEFVGSFRAPQPETDKDPSRPRIFGIGLNKTGTASLHKALTILGYDSLHWGGPALRRLVEASLEAGDPVLSRLDPRFDAFSDIQVLSTNFDRLDEQYPGSRFVLTVRPVEEWLDSRRRHVESNLRRKAAGEYGGTFVTIDEAAWREEWQQHVDKVRAYFAGRDDFLEIDIDQGPTWLPLCELLGVPEPADRFPWVNRDQSARTEPS